MAKRKMTEQCRAFGCKKRRKAISLTSYERSDSEGSDDDESAIKRLFPRTFHRFPCDESMRRLWIQSVHREGFAPSKNSRLCSDHFYERNLCRLGRRTELRKDAVPTRFKKIPNCLKKACIVDGCNKIFKGSLCVRSDSEGSSDEESAEKRKHPRTLHTFPSDHLLRLRWLKNMGREDWNPSECSVICSDHFREKYLKRNDSHIILLPSAVPTRFKGCANHFEMEIHDSDTYTPEEPEVTNHPSNDESAISNEDVNQLCIRSTNHDHNYSFPTCPEKLLKIVRTQSQQIDRLQKALKSTRSSYANLKAKCSKLKREIVLMNEYSVAEH